MSSERLVIIHFAALEYYPPIQNLLRELEREDTNVKIKVLTTRLAGIKLNTFNLQTDRIKLIRLGKSSQKLPPFIRYINYLLFYSASLILLIWHRPKRILYFETISSWPAIIYKRFLNTNCEIMIHYHEYTSGQEYREGMTLNDHFHQLERWLYPRASWVSHTNEFRMERFREDISPIIIENAQVIPNYPPLKWQVADKKELALPLKVVYIGALSMDTMYVENFAHWIIQQKGKVIWDIYSYTFTSEAEKFIQKLTTPWISLKPGVDYEMLPAILKEYSVGVILYKGHIVNYVLNAPNKLFEYLACGLSVWLPTVMKGSIPYCTESTFPEVVALDFDAIGDTDLKRFFKPTEKISKQSVYFCEMSVASLVNKLLGK